MLQAEANLVHWLLVLVQFVFFSPIILILIYLFCRELLHSCQLNFLQSRKKYDMSVITISSCFFGFDLSLYQLEWARYHPDPGRVRGLYQYSSVIVVQDIVQSSSDWN